MVEFLIQISQRPLVIALAIIGALLVIAGSLIAKPQTGRGPGHSGAGGQEHSSPQPRYDQKGHVIDPPADAQTLWSRRLSRAGYAITFVSIALFIIAGFVSDLQP